MKRNDRNHTKEEKQKSLDYYHERKSATKTIRALGYPTRSCMNLWIEAENNLPKIAKLVAEDMHRPNSSEKQRKGSDS